MNPSEKDPISLDEKIALIRKKNEMIIKRKELIEKEIEIAKKHNAMVDVSAPKTVDDDRPTLYSDTISKSFKEERKRSIPDKVNYKPRGNTKDEAAWRAERNEIDRERIRRQRADSGWRREWDADKHVPDDEFQRNNFVRRDNSKETPHTRSSHNQSVETRQNQYKSKENDVPVESSEKQAPRQKLSRGRGRPVVSVDTPKITQNLRRTVNVEPANLKQPEKSPLKKRVSWGSENELLLSRRICLKDDRLKNIKVKVNTSESNARNRSIEITQERGPLVKNNKVSKFDEKSSFHIKDCVAKASSNKSYADLHAVQDAQLHKPRESSSAKFEPKPILIKCNLDSKRESSVGSHVTVAEHPSKEEVNTGDDEEWEDMSGEEWESDANEE